MNIDFLANKKEYISEIFEWYKQEWGYLNPCRTDTQLLEKISSRLNSKKAPCILVGSSGEEIVGTVTLCLDEVEELPQTFPWLSSLYVSEKHRRQGFGELLVHACIQEARNLGYKEIYLLTDKEELVNWYKEMGWKHYRFVYYKKANVQIFFYSMV
ncbi:MAG: GNAT family N-acetyltransferase [Coxiellaceae bacterium]|nr:GNAT family N-acetyltransferase [Coxiellaceae bacterium]